MQQNLEMYNEITAFISQIFVDAGIDITPDENGWKINITIEPDYLMIKNNISPMVYHLVILHAYGAFTSDITEENYKDIEPQLIQFINNNLKNN